ncbi:hypothetical protein M378DRAFT_361480 [Amanita muscaria Koide BX008]|uniref:Uncharacterized protein n=1 Tax=Amanita muscaria (strain Koide BX008) TaxID=946122 RepID=A0A0C2SUL5_AMAMK|nr:hypothetical protein M378DRAFT_361480 [Amanita muscaria Koide BX008]
MPQKKAKAKEENRSVPSGRLVLLMGNRTILLDLLLFRRQDHSSSNTNNTSFSNNMSMSDSRASRDNQVLFLVICFRQTQRQGHRVASSLSEGEKEDFKRLLLLPIQLCGSKPAGLIRPFLLNPVSPSEIFRRHMTANGSSSSIPPQPIQEASSLAPPISVDTHMQSQQSGMEVVNLASLAETSMFRKVIRAGAAEQRCWESAEKP